MHPLPRRFLRAAALALFFLAFSWSFFGWVPRKNVILAADVLALVPPWARGPATVHNILLTDPVWQFYPWALELRRAILSGRFPLWDPSIRAGVPIAANPIAAYFFPLTWLVIPFGTGAGISLAVLLRPFLASLFLYLYLRRARFSMPSSLLGAVTFGASLPFLVWAEHPQDNAFLLLPLALLTVDAVFENRWRAAVTALAAVLGLLALSGHPESILHVTLFLLAYSAVQASRFRRRGGARGGGRVLLAGLLAASLTIFALYPQALCVLRSEPMQGSGHLARALPLRTAAGLFFPAFFGSPGPGQSLPDVPGNLNEAAFFFGLLPLTLVPLSLRPPRRVRRIPGPLFWILAAAVALVLVFLAPRSSLFLRLPVLGKMFHNRLSVLLGLPIGVLAAEGVERIRGRRDGGGKLWLVSLVVLAPFGLVVGFVTANRAPSAAEMGLAFAASAAGGVCLALRRSTPRTAVALLCAAHMLDLWRAGAGYHPRVPAAAVFPPFSLASAISRETGEGRFLAFGIVFPPNSSTVYGLRDLRGYDALESQQMRLFWKRLIRWSPDQRLPPMTAIGFTPDSGRLLPLIGVRTFWTSPRVGIDPEHAERLGLHLSLIASSREGNLYRLERAPGRFQVVGRVLPRSPVSACEPTAALDGSGVSCVDEISHPVVYEGASQANIRVREDEPERILLEARSPGGFLLRVADEFDPGWHARLDGRPVKIWRTDGVFRGVFVPAGAHQIRLRYRLPGFPLTAILSAAAAALLLARLLSIIRS